MPRTMASLSRKRRAAADRDQVVAADAGLFAQGDQQLLELVRLRFEQIHPEHRGVAFQRVDLAEDAVDQAEVVLAVTAVVLQRVLIRNSVCCAWSR
jgi:hypothetical protein